MGMCENPETCPECIESREKLAKVYETYLAGNIRPEDDIFTKNQKVVDNFILGQTVNGIPQIDEDKKNSIVIIK